MKYISISELCKRLAKLDDMSACKKALALLLWLEENTDKLEYTSGELARLMTENALGSPNSTQLKNSIVKSRLAMKRGNFFRLKTASKPVVESWIKDIISHKSADINHSEGYLPDDIWRDTKGYVEKVCEQLNGCVNYGFFDASAVLVRRLVETLIIESFIFLKRDSEIKDASDNYMMMSGLVDITLGKNGLTLGRDSKKYLKDLKALGDRSAHKRNYNAVKSDLTQVRTALRVVVDELIHISNLK